MSQMFQFHTRVVSGTLGRMPLYSFLFQTQCEVFNFNILCNCNGYKASFSGPGQTSLRNRKMHWFHVAYIFENVVKEQDRRGAEQGEGELESLHPRCWHWLWHIIPPHPESPGFQRWPGGKMTSMEVASATRGISQLLGPSHLSWEPPSASGSSLVWRRKALVGQLMGASLLPSRVKAEGPRAPLFFGTPLANSQRDSRGQNTRRSQPRWIPDALPENRVADSLEEETVWQGHGCTTVNSQWGFQGFGVTL